MSDLMLIESFAKSKAISQYIEKKNIKVVSTHGHVRELDKYGLGFNTETYEIKWKNIDKKIKFDDKQFDAITLINEEADKAKKIYLSTDPDREGEGIAWHIFNVLSDENKSKCIRASFNEITKDAIENALKNPRPIDQNQVDAYLSRRLLDRLIGFKLSSYTYKKMGGISAGRVQSIALKFLKDKKEEIDNFQPEYWFELITFLNNGMELNLKELSSDWKDLQLKDKNSKGSTLGFVVEEEITKLKESLNSKFILKEISEIKVTKQAAPEALETSSMLSMASQKLGLNSKITSQTAQKLYEGVDIQNETVGLITYPRTDRTDFSEQFLKQAKQFIEKEYTKTYWEGPQVKTKKTKDQLVQGAHEGIRPTDLKLTPEIMRPYLSAVEYKLYELIWVYTVCSLMKPTLFNVQDFVFENNGNKFKSNIRKEIFDGYKKVMKEYGFQNFTEDLDIDPKTLVEGNDYDYSTLEIKAKETKPPSPYSEAKLITSLKENGIGRPSTYDKIANIVLDRKYAYKEGKSILISELGLKVSRDLEENFSNFIRYDYTRNMESELDNISEAKTHWKEFLKTIFNDFDIELKEALKKIPEKQIEIVEGKTCPKCESELIYKFSHRNQEKFIACIRFPKCKHSESAEPPELLDKKCPECDCQLVKKKNKKNSFFIACSGYPKCMYVENDEKHEKLDEKCEQCNRHLVKKKNKWGKDFVACSGYPLCKYIKNDLKTLDEKCPECDGWLVVRGGRWSSDFIGCQNFPKCKYIKRDAKDKKEGDSKRKYAKREGDVKKTYSKSFGRNRNGSSSTNARPRFNRYKSSSNSSSDSTGSSDTSAISNTDSQPRSSSFSRFKTSRNFKNSNGRFYGQNSERSSQKRTYGGSSDRPFSNRSPSSTSSRTNGTSSERTFSNRSYGQSSGRTGFYKNRSDKPYTERPSEGQSSTGRIYRQYPKSTDSSSQKRTYSDSGPRSYNRFKKPGSSSNRGPFKSRSSFANKRTNNVRKREAPKE